MSYTEVSMSERRFPWALILLILYIIGSIWAFQKDYSRENAQHQEIVKLQLDLVEHVRRIDFIYEELKTLAYMTDVMAENMKELFPAN